MTQHLTFFRAYPREAARHSVMQIITEGGLALCTFAFLWEDGAAAAGVDAVGSLRGRSAEEPEGPGLDSVSFS